jgi:hypothetical protein
MNGKRISVFFMLSTAWLFAFGRAPAARSEVNPKVVFQFLTIVHEDGSAEFESILKFSREQIEENLKKGTYSEDAFCENSTSEIERFFGSFNQEKHGEDIWCSYSTEVDNLQGLSNALEDDFSLTVQRLEIEDETFYLDLSWKTFPCTITNPADFTCEWSVEAPGEIGDNNATRVEGRTLTWDFSEKNISRRFTAESKVGGIDPAVWIVLGILSCGCCTLILLVAGGTAAFFFLRRKKKASADSDPAEANPSSLQSGSESVHST